MTAVQLTQLKQKIKELLFLFSEPQAFRKQLQEIFEFYGYHVYHPGRNSKDQNLMPSYRLNPIILQQMERALILPSQRNPNEALDLADELWLDTHKEIKLIGAFILGQISIEAKSQVVDRINTWYNAETHQELINVALGKSSMTIRQSDPESWVGIMTQWLNHPEDKTKLIALNAIHATLADPLFVNIPPIYNILSPILRKPEQALQNKIYEVLRALAHRSPAETAYYLRQIISTSNHPRTIRLIRRVLPAFEPQDQRKLKEALDLTKTANK
jgi:hypothetical protein